MNSRRLVSVTSFALIAGSVLFTSLAFRPPPPQPASAPETAFSAERAMVHVRAIAQRPHPAGSAEHARVHDYIVAQLNQLGLATEIQQAPSIGEYPIPFGATYHVAARVRNIIARLPGRSSTRPVLLMAHYDSVQASPGANDDGTAVAALLETARALRASERPLANDVLFLFTDAEEVGLLGSKAFFERSPLKQQLGAVLNFEARGTHGPVLMFETGPGNGWLIRELASTVPNAFASSLFDAVYQYLPNMTDFTLAKSAGIPGLNFAYIGSLSEYHSTLDAPENVDAGSLQHHGEYALLLAQQLGERDLSQPSPANMTFFNVGGPMLVYYPAQWTVPLALLAVLLWLGTVTWGVRQGHLRVLQLIWGVLFMLLHLVVIAIVITALALLAGAVHGEFRRSGDTYNSHLYMIGLACITLAATTSMALLLRRRLGAYPLAAGASFWWALFTGLTAFWLPGGSFLFTWPLLFATLSLALLFSHRTPQPGTWRLLGALTLSAVPSILIVTPILYLMFVGLTLRMAAAPAIMTVLLLGLLTPHLHELTATRRWLLPILATAVGTAYIVVASYPAASTAERPRQSNVVYLMDADRGQALWASSDDRLEGWTRQFFEGEVRHGRLPDFMPRWHRDFHQGPAPVLSATPPRLEVLEDTVVADRRTIRARVASTRGARTAALFIADAPVLAYSVEGMQGPNALYTRALADSPAGGSEDWNIWLEGMATQGSEVSLTVPAGRKFTIRVLDRSDDLPQLPGFSYQPRPRDVIPSAGLDVEMWGHSTYVSKALAMEAMPASSAAEGNVR